MTTTGITLAGRRAAGRLMIDACRITRGPGARSLNKATGGYETAPGELLYDGPCRVKPVDNADRVVDAGGEAVSLWPFTVSLPVDAVRYGVDDTVTVTAAQIDPSLVGLVLRVRQVAQGSHLTARRLGCEGSAG